jgi:hypothetical protein
MKTELSPPPAPTGRSPAPTFTTVPEAAALDRKMLGAALHDHWPFLKTELKERYLVLTDDDLAYAEGQEDELLDRLERRTCRPRREFEELILAQSAHFS